VKESKPKLVITDDYRVGDAKLLAKEITKRLGIKAKALPEMRQAHAIDTASSKVTSRKGSEKDENTIRKNAQNAAGPTKQTFRVKNIDLYR
jgi:hypothetical protein